ncbi:hypothetical protein VTI28DRAFT_1436 [Corynascus sepedonium]
MGRLARMRRESSEMWWVRTKALAAAGNLLFDWKVEDCVIRCHGRAGADIMYMLSCSKPLSAPEVWRRNHCQDQAALGVSAQRQTGKTKLSST